LLVTLILLCCTGTWTHRYSRRRDAEMYPCLEALAFPDVQPHFDAVEELDRIAGKRCLCIWCGRVGASLCACCVFLLAPCFLRRVPPCSFLLCSTADSARLLFYPPLQIFTWLLTVHDLGRKSCKTTFQKAQKANKDSHRLRVLRIGIWYFLVSLLPSLVQRSLPCACPRLMPGFASGISSSVS
jgi:hypothetical protein